MNKVFSKDGTEIAYDIQGQGAAVIFVDGALGYRSFGPMPELAKLISTDFTAITYDRRGRGDSGDNKPYALEREIEDIEALIDEAGGVANLYGVSSGGCLVLEAAIKLGDKVKKLAVYEPPYNSDKAAAEEWRQYTEKLMKLLAANSRSDAVALFMAFVGSPAVQIEGMRKAPAWSMFEAIAPTLAYDAAAMGGAERSIPVERVSHITASTLVMHGDAGMPFMKQTAQTLSKVIRNAEFRTIEGQTHAASSEAIAPVLVEFFKK
jgi:pimeloyl-ACP methyl ester carboxylesterase